MPGEQNYTPYQKKVISRYYEHRPALMLQRLGELVAELYLAEGKKRDRLWKSAGEAMEKLSVPSSRIEHVLKQRDPAVLAVLVKELSA
jgi:hypothetical protein